jgi:membrane protease YdiL (CAAX protease family)
MTLLVMGVALAPIGASLFPGEGLPAQIRREAIFWSLTVLLIAYVLIVERRPLGSIGLSAPRWTSLAFGLAGAAITIAGMAFIYLVVFPAFNLSDASQFDAVLSPPLWFLASLVLRAAIFEEIFFRGFMIERLSEIARSRWLAAALSLAAFTLAHLGGWGWAHLIVAGFGGFVLTVLYLWRRDLVANMIAHLVTNTVGFLLA